MGSIDDHFHLKDSKLMRIIGWTCVIIGFSGVVYGIYNGTKVAYKAITHKELKITLPTQPREIHYSP